MAAAEPSGIFLAKPPDAPDGKRLAVKDLFDTAGLTTTYGSIVYSEHVPERSAEAVTRLEAAGFVNVGKTNLHEFAYGITSVNPHYGTVPNPAFPGRMAGGSSGGSAAALAAGIADYALGTDSGGSIRIPAACCGTVGFKPTYGLVSLDGVFPLAPSFDHAGPMARTVAECAELMEVLADGFQPETLDSLDDLDVGLAWLDRAQPLVEARVRDAARLFPRLREVDFPLAEKIGPVFMREVAGVHQDLFAEFADSYGENVRIKVELCLAVSDGEYEAGVRAREELRERAESAMEGFDLLVTPTLGFVAPEAPGRRSRHPRGHDPLHVSVQRARVARARSPVRPGGGRRRRFAADRGPAGRRRTRPRGRRARGVTPLATRRVELDPDRGGRGPAPVSNGARKRSEHEAVSALNVQAEVAEASAGNIVRVGPKREGAVRLGAARRDCRLRVNAPREERVDASPRWSTALAEHGSPHQHGSVGVERGRVRRHVVEAEHGQLEAGRRAVGVDAAEHDRPVAVAVEADPKLQAAALLELHPVDGPAAPRALADLLRAGPARARCGRRPPGRGSRGTW